MAAEPSPRIRAPAIEELRWDLVTHLRTTKLSFVVDGGRHYLTIPGHLPILSAPVPSRATGTHFYEETTTLALNFLLSRVRPRRFWDVGAGQGYFSRVAASFRQGAPEVDAFEMRPDEVRRMRRTLQGDPFAGRIRLHQAAMSDKDVADALVWQARSLLFEEQPTRGDYEEAWWRRLKFWLRNDKTRGLFAFATDVASIDGFAKRSGRSPDVIKIDVEGYEGRVLRGARETLRKSRPYVLLELHADGKQRFGLQRHEIAQCMFDAGYDALFFTDHQNKSRCEVLTIGPGDAVLRRPETDLVLFVPR
jgi:FkbM family methyltransferase